MRAATDADGNIIYSGTDAQGTEIPVYNMLLRKNGDYTPPSYSESHGIGRNWYFETALNYARRFGKHDFSGLVLYNQSKTYYPNGSYSDIPHGYVGLVGRVTYNYDYKYMAEFNMGYNGSENFAPGKRYGFFPAGSVGWVVSEEKFFKPLKKVVSFLKLRASWGGVGSDWLGSAYRLNQPPDP